MEKIKYVYYQEGDAWVGWLEAYPDYKSQGMSLEELEENLRDIYAEINTGKIPHIRKIGELALK
ncbi:MAG: type II toxin-antitoxin system HicB family antitoxin [Dehalococcoidia bacterium]|nr:MAG: type II toxin-antitoxin system HicB family antitoxin [Dehalococcoidia bacterium]